MIMDMYDLKREDILYGTDVRERIADLESERDAYIDERLSKLGDDAQDDETMHDAYASEWAEANPSEAEELRKLEEFNEEAEGYGDGRNWDAVNEDYFESYAEQLASDIGAIQPDAGWPLMFIDWKAAAEALKQDYTEIELDGQSFWTR